jgi:hypothetical protein
MNYSSPANRAPAAGAGVGQYQPPAPLRPFAGAFQAIGQAAGNPTLANVLRGAPAQAMPQPMPQPAPQPMGMRQVPNRNFFQY